MTWQDEAQYVPPCRLLYPVVQSLQTANLSIRILQYESNSTWFLYCQTLGLNGVSLKTIDTNQAKSNALQTLRLTLKDLESEVLNASSD